MTGRDAKRKAAAAFAGDDDTRTPKRQKATNESSESVQEAGFRFLQILKQAKDKTGRPIATDFLELPNRHQYPDYYKHIALPISINYIEDKLNNGRYPDLSALESDLKRMVNNAKTYNEKGSDIYEDAERLRKTASNWMTKHNPAYREIPGYQAQPTPLPEGKINGAPTVSTEQTDRPKRATTAASTPQTTSRLRATSNRESVESTLFQSKDFIGKTFQEAQDQIISELIDYKDEGSSLRIFEPFKFLPPRSLKDYYELIRHPVSLDALRKKVRGIHGKAQIGTGITDFTSWAAFEDEVGYIWRNAREYNEDGSEMYNLAGEFETIFKERLEEAKSKVDQPEQPRLKLTMSTKPVPPIKLRIGGSIKDSPGPQSHAGTPDPRKSATPGVIVDTNALARQKQHVAAGVNGSQLPQLTPQPIPGNPFGNARPGSIPPLGQSHNGRSGSAASPPLTSNGVKAEMQPGQSPAPNAVRPPSATPAYQPQPYTAPSVMLPPPSMPRVTSGSPLPYASTNPYSQQYHAPAPLNGFERKFRAPGKTAKDALLPKVTLQSHPSLILPKPYQLDIPAHPERAQQSLTITLPASHHYLQVIPTLPPGMTTRPYRLIVLVNGQRLAPMAATPQMGAAASEESRQKRFDARLKVGEVNQIDIELLAAVKSDDGKERVEWEKCTVFVYLR